MTEMYGHRWASQQGEEPNDTWVRGLHDVTAKQLGKGLVFCRDSAEGWPPTLPEFRAVCLGDQGLIAADKAAHRIYQPDRLLDSITADDRRGKLADIMAIL
jgi:hypothetical protein